IMLDITLLDLSASMGLVASIVLTFNFLLGMMISTTYKKHKYWKSLPQRIKQINIYNLHNWTAYFALFLVLLHPLFLLFDKTTKFKLNDIFFPINAPTQKVFVTLGTLSMFALMIVVITTQKVIRDKISFRAWKNIHLISYTTAMLFVVHGIVMDPLLKNRPVDIFDAEKVVSELCLVVLLVAAYLRYKFHNKTKIV
ncbi:ferric reductase-like transmembrane domain-containing protein, partial [Flavobacterium collinsii]